MNLYEAQEFYNKMFPGKKIDYEFDDKCIRQIECIYTDSNLHMLNHIEYQQVKANVDGIDPVYIPIKPHRILISAAQLKDKISNDNIFIHPEILIQLKKMMEDKDSNLKNKLEEISLYSGLSEDQIISKLP